MVAKQIIKLKEEVEMKMKSYTYLFTVSQARRNITKNVNIDVVKKINANLEVGDETVICNPTSIPGPSR